MMQSKSSTRGQEEMRIDDLELDEAKQAQRKRENEKDEYEDTEGLGNGNYA